jgi:hypothetical protein
MIVLVATLESPLTMPIDPFPPPSPPQLLDEGAGGGRRDYG